MSVPEVLVPEVSVPEVSVPVSVRADTSETDTSGTWTGTVSQQLGPPNHAASPFFVANNMWWYSILDNADSCKWYGFELYHVLDTVPFA